MGGEYFTVGEGSEEFTPHPVKPVLQNRGEGCTKISTSKKALFF
jgi:hypothetical protein